MTGVVKTYDRMLCYGFIGGEDGHDYFVHRSEVHGPPLQVGERVEFDPTEAPRGPRAVGVRKLEDAPR